MNAATDCHGPGFDCQIHLPDLAHQVRASGKVHPELDSKDAFRVMNLRPGVGSDELRIDLEVVYHEAAPSYEAISYAWGDGTRTEVIKAGSECLNVTTNLGDALRAMRDPHTERCLWADAVCIDQENVLERNHQVRQMAELFANADNVLVWLGTDPDLSGDGAFDCARVLADPNQRDSAMDDVEYSRYAIDLLRRLTKRPWFCRLWTTQEIGLASHGICLCGDSKIEWRLLAAAYDFLLRHPASQGVVGEAERSELDVHLVRKWKQHTELTFLELVESVQNRSCTDPRDRIFALLAHPSATVVDEDSGDRLPIVDPDYRSSLSKVFHQAAVGIIESSGNLDVLSHVRRADTADGAAVRLPSWVPNWNKPRQLAPRTRAHNQAWGSLDFYLQDLPEFSVKGELQTNGVLYDRVSQRYKPLGLSSIHMWQRQLAGLLEGPIFMPFDWSIALCDMLFDERAAYKFHRRAVETRSVMDKFQRLKRLAQALSDVPDNKEQLLSLIRSIASNMAANDPKTFFVTEGGRIGLAFLNPSASGYWKLRLGDVIVVLERGRVPYVLRSQSDGKLRSGADSTYCLIGDCYVPSLMNGEAWTLPATHHRRVTIA